MVYQSILKFFKRLFIPFTTITTSSLFLTFNKALAATKENIPSTSEWLWKNGSVKNNPFSSEHYNDNIINRASDTVDTWERIGRDINDILDWFNHLPENIVQMSINLMAWLYEMITKLVLTTPLWIFKNAWFVDTTMTFSMISVAIVVVLSLIEIIKSMYNHKKIHFTKFSDVLKRLPIATAGAGFAPFLFVSVFNVLNKITHAITEIGRSEIVGTEVTVYDWTGLNLFAILGFDIVLIGLIFPIFLHNGVRFFNLMSLGVMTPFALSAWIFDSYRHYFSKWWKNVKHYSLIQLTYAIFICIIGLFIFGTRNIAPTDPQTLILKLCVVCGGLFQLSHPPSFVLSAGDHGKNTWDVGKDLFNWLTFKNYAPLKFYKDRKKEIFGILQRRDEKRRTLNQQVRNLTGKRHNK